MRYPPCLPGRASFTQKLHRVYLYDVEICLTQRSILFLYREYKSFRGCKIPEEYPALYCAGFVHKQDRKGWKRMKKGLVFLLTACVTAASLLTGCGSGNSKSAEQVDLNSATLDEIKEKAKEEGEVNSAGMPDDWANWGATWEGLNKEYGLKHTDVIFHLLKNFHCLKRRKRTLQRILAMLAKIMHLLPRKRALRFLTRRATGMRSRTGQRMKMEMLPLPTMGPWLS